MKTSRLVKGYLIFEAVALVIFGYLLTPSFGTGVFLLGPRIGLVAAFLALPINPVIGIIGLVISGQELYKKHRTALVIILLVASLGFTLLFPATAVERGISHMFGSMLQ